MFVEIPFPEINPTLIAIPKMDLAGIGIGPFAVRWYALAYIVGILSAATLVRAIIAQPQLWAKNAPTIDSNTVADCVLNITIGILAGGRLGFIFFYYIPIYGGNLFDDPLVIFRLWEGGMAFHGAIIGVALALVYSAHVKGFRLRAALFGPRNTKEAILCRSGNAHFLAYSDLTCATAPIGLLLGRGANFINGELYGRPTDLPWAMRFPTWNTETQNWIYTGNEPLVHPSQLYEAATEGALLFLLLMAGVWKFGILKYPGCTTGLFLAGYAVARICVENFRDPDAQLTVLPFTITMGMVLSVPMLILGAAMMRYALKNNS